MHDTIWAPWRNQYLQTLGDRPDDGGLPDFISAAFADPAADETNFVIVRSDAGLIMLNRYPYANGHLLVALGEAQPSLLDYDAASRASFWSLIEQAWGLIRTALNPHGVNMGINEGAAAGAGLPGHLHAHVVPRWQGDVNFMSTVGASRVIPASLDAVATLYRNAAHG